MVAEGEQLVDGRTPPATVTARAYRRRMDDTTKTSADRFLDLHVKGTPLVMANAWDAGSAKLLASIGFRPVDDVMLFPDKYFVIYGRR